MTREKIVMEMLKAESQGSKVFLTKEGLERMQDILTITDTQLEANESEAV